MSTAMPREHQIRVGGVLRAVRALEPVDIAFAASVDAAAGTFVLDRFEGARTDRLRNLSSPIGEGVGGRCIALGRPVVVKDYATAKGITHRFDREVAGEGLSAMFAVPVTRDGVLRDVVYGAVRRPMAFGERLIDEAVAIVRRSGAPVAGDGAQEADAPRWWTTRDVADEIAKIAAGIAEPALRRRLQELGACLSGLTESPVDAGPQVRLTSRELDVLTAVAMGHGNVEVGRRLGLTVQTVKSYLKSAMAKLDSHTRGEAVYRARVAGLLP